LTILNYNQLTGYHPAKTHFMPQETFDDIVPEEIAELDEVDIKILRLLQDNCRLTNKEIGEKLHKTSSPINDRIHRMQEQGVIKKYAAVLNHRKINLGLIAFTHVQLKDHSEQSLTLFESEIIKNPEVLECYHMSGEYDFILRVATVNLPAYHHWLMTKLFRILPVGSVQSTFVMKEAKAQAPYPIKPTKK